MNNVRALADAERISTSGDFKIPDGAIKKNYRLFPECKYLYSKQPSDIGQLGECCVNTCNKKFEQCSDNCNDLYKNNKFKLNQCKNNCTILNSNLCRQYCRLSSDQFIPYSSIFECAAKYGCMSHQNDLPDYDCVQEKRPVIHQCFREYCSKNDISPDSCQSYLDFMTTLPFKPKEYKYISKNKENFALKENMLANTQSNSPYSQIIIAFGVYNAVAYIIIISLIIWFALVGHV